MNTNSQFYLYTTSSGIELIEGDKMPVKDFPDFWPKAKAAYEATLQAAKASGIPVMDPERAVSIIAHGQTILDIEKAKAHYCKPGEVYGPFDISYEIRYRTPEGIQLKSKRYFKRGETLADMKEGIPYAILHDDTPATNNNLLPCPFCGLQPEWINEALADSHYYIKCPNCHIVMKEDRRDKVIGMWNNRFTITRKQ